MPEHPKQEMSQSNSLEMEQQEMQELEQSAEQPVTAADTQLQSESTGYKNEDFLYWEQ